MNFRNLIGLSLFAAALTVSHAALTDDAELLKVREIVWRAWFTNDKETLTKLVPPETIVISAGDKGWKHQTQVLEEAAQFVADGGRLVGLKFPQTEVQHFGYVAVIWSSYELETEVKGKRFTSRGRVTEVFVQHDGQWMNPGWHTSHPPDP